MARIQSPPILGQIRVARTYSEQAAALRALKDEVIGHTQRKERWIETGILESLVKILQQDTRPRSPTRTNGKEPNSAPGQPKPLADDELVRLLSLQLLASFACGGPSLLEPLHAVGAVPLILSHINPADNPPQVVVTALRALNNIVNATGLAPHGLNDSSALAQALFGACYLEALYDILTRDTRDPVEYDQKRMVCWLIGRLCSTPEHQSALADAGILDALAGILASFVVARGEVIPGAEVLGQEDGLIYLIPPPAPPGLSLALVLEAISAIIADSRLRVMMLVLSPAIQAVFPRTEFDPLVAEHKAAWAALEMNGLHEFRSPCAIDYLLPVVPIAQPRSSSVQFAQFPPLGVTRDSLPSGSRPSTFKFTGWDVNAAAETLQESVEPESPLVPWLIHIVRSTSGFERVAAASVVTSIYKAHFANAEREHFLGFLVVPVLMRMIKENDFETSAATRQSLFIEPSLNKSWAVLERATEVLARLVADSEVLQQAAYDCGAIQLACKLLKDSYEPLQPQSPRRPWSPTPEHRPASDEGLPTCRVGPPGQLPWYAHMIRQRESALKLIAALATLKDEFRKALSESDAVPYVMESLSRVPTKPKSAKEKTPSDKGMDGRGRQADHSPYGINPNKVIIAACHAVRALARSVSILRTDLKDHAVDEPILKLMRHADAEVQIAASSVVINLLTSVSPMRDSLMDAGVIKVLCEQAHSQNPGMRLNAIWGLKHVILEADNDLRKQCLEELEPGWLVQLVSDDKVGTEGFSGRTRRDRRTMDLDEDEDMEVESNSAAGGYDDEGLVWSWPPMYRDMHPGFMAARGQSKRLKKAEANLVIMREIELNPTRRARNDNWAIQEQALDFIRNFLVASLEGQDATELIDYLFSQIGEGRLFELLAEKLQPKMTGAYGRRYSRGRDTVVLYPQPRIVESLMYILVHIAASIPRHRQLVMAQTELLKLVGANSNNEDAGVRRALCQLLINLTCHDGESDKVSVVQRVDELGKLGFLTKLESLETGDADLDVRERAKSAVSQIKTGM